jgi:hypothetical protein
MEQFEAFLNALPPQNLYQFSIVVCLVLLSARDVRSNLVRLVAIQPDIREEQTAQSGVRHTAGKADLFSSFLFASKSLFQKQSNRAYFDRDFL